MDLLGMLAGGGLLGRSSSTISNEAKFAVLDGDVSIEGLVKKISNFSNIIVLCGAGISVAAGIPDFRTPGTGLYDNLQKYSLQRPEQIFEINFFKRNPMPFYELTKELLPEGVDFTPTKTHRFIKLLADRNLLLRCYTQNIDGLEVAAGVPPELVIEAHGHFRTCRCCECKTEYDIATFKRRLYSSQVPILCNEATCEGLVKPDVVFFGEGLPASFRQGMQFDFKNADLCIVIGTSLVVAPFCTLVDKFGETVPRLLINREAVGPWEEWERRERERQEETPEAETEAGTETETEAEAEAEAVAEGESEAETEAEADAIPEMKGNYRDVAFLGDCDDKVTELCEMCGWEFQ